VRPQDVFVNVQTYTTHWSATWNETWNGHLRPYNSKTDCEDATGRKISTGSMVWYGLKRAVRRVADKKG